MNNHYQALTVNEDALKVVKEFIKNEKEGNSKARNKAKIDLYKHLIKTDDGSYTLESKIYDSQSETMHTRHGAITESLEKFIKPAKLEGKKKVRVLDICSGLGYNAASCIEYLNEDVKIEIDLVEISKNTLAMILLLDNPVKSYRIIKKAVEDKLYGEGIIRYKACKKEIPDRISINIHTTDARVLVKDLQNHERYDAIFLDPFSPLKSPELYTNEFFLNLKDLLEKNGVILTYTSAAPVRAAIVNCGIHVGEGPRFGRSGGTIATLTPEMIDKPLSVRDERMIALSDAGVPFKDPYSTDSAYSIHQRRDAERKAKRGKEKFASTVKTPIYLNEKVEDGRLKRRVLKNIHQLGFNDLNSFKARYVVCPQYDNCICGNYCKSYNYSQERIKEMSKRLIELLN